MKAPEIFISTGEVSGDLHGAALLKALRRHRPDLKAFGIGGDRLAREGMEIQAGIDQLSLVGVAEVIPRIGSLLRLLGRTRRSLAARRPLAVVLIDSPDFNLQVARVAKGLGLKVIYYIGPSVWAWRRGRIHTVRKRVDLMLTILPFEKDLYTSRGVRALFVGHPLAGLKVDKDLARSFLQSTGLPPDATAVALLPGSRANEIRRHMPALLETVQRLRRDHEDLHFLVPAASAEISRIIKSHPGAAEPYLTVVDGQARHCLEVARAAVVTSGTATLEAALIGTPFATIYRLAPLSYLIGRIMVKTPYISLPNILAGEEVVEEFIQDDCRGSILAPALERLLNDDAARRTMMGHFDNIRENLAAGSVDERAAAAVAAETMLADGPPGRQPS